jgi:hypothetical protein
LAFATNVRMRGFAFAAISVALIGLLTVAAPWASARPSLSCLVTDVTSGTGGFRTLQAAVDAAASGDTLVVRGTCYGTTSILDKDLTIQGQANPAFGAPTLDGQNSGTVLWVGSPEDSPTVSISGLTIMHGSHGGVVSYGTLTLLDSTVRLNAGGGISNAYGAYLLTLVRSTVSGNTDGFRGGGIWNRALLAMTDSWVTDNVAGAEGGGIWSNGYVDLTGSHVSGNRSEGDGGGIFNLGTLTLSQATVQQNTSGGNGGGIWNNQPLIMTDSTVRENTAALGGGGIINFLSGTGTVTDSAVTDNTALDGSNFGSNVGGGISDCPGALTLQGTIVIRNVPDDFGTAYCPVF